MDKWKGEGSPDPDGVRGEKRKNHSGPMGGLHRNGGGESLGGQKGPSERENHVGPPKRKPVWGCRGGGKRFTQAIWGVSCCCGEVREKRVRGFSQFQRDHGKSRKKMQGPLGGKGKKGPPGGGGQCPQPSRFRIIGNRS